MRAFFYPSTPYISAPTSVSAMMLDVIVALIPALGMSVYLFGVSALLMVGTSVLACVGFEALVCAVAKKPSTLGDYSACVTGLLLAFCFPPEAPLWGIIIAAFSAIVIIKGLYGGLGQNFMNPTLAGWLIASTIPAVITQYTIPIPLQNAFLTDVISSATPMTYLGAGALPPLTKSELFIGFHSGAMGEGSTMMLVLGLAYLVIRRVISPVIPVMFLGTVALCTYYFPPNGVDSFDWMVAQLCSGGLVLGASFMATDPTTTPITLKGQVMFGLGCGLMTVLLRNFGTYPEGVGFAILTMNGLVWLLDQVGAPRRFSAEHFTVTRRVLQYLSEKWKKIYFIRPKMPKIAQIRRLFARPEGMVPGEKYLDHLEQATKSGGALACVIAVVLVGLTMVSNLTQFPLRTQEESNNRALLEQVMPLATNMSEMPYKTADVTAIYAAYDQLSHVGYCVEVLAPGFNGEMTIIIGVDLDSAITGVTVLSHSETKYIGTRALEQSVLDTFAGRSGRLSLTGSNRVDSISGATVTQQGVVSGVNTALSYIQELEREGAFHILSGEFLLG
ncbi:MAG: RnfABCDGE type electron transport complex subunit D [Eubacteriales bacterium]